MSVQGVTALITAVTALVIAVGKVLYDIQQMRTARAAARHLIDNPPTTGATDAGHGPADPKM